ncbi:helix-turn-helix transcriptional regulator [Spirillospora sp. NPDC029432]|uniref:helix-turn-helix domain-containing protein n=1 Tax=Spirillospora sp. NPDC029432 TaxID=3154599 RepID=UPI0034547140
MAAATPATVRHRLLVQKLRRLREDAGFTQAEVAQAMDWSESKQIKMERGNIPVRIPDVRALLVHYGLVGPEHQQETDAVLQLARDARRKGWWHTYGDAVPEWFEPFLGLETEATSIRTYQPELVPGLLQTQDYHQGLLRTSPAVRSAETIDRMTTLREQRQQRLEGPNATTYWAIMNEAVLMRPPGSTALMKAQLTHIVERMELPAVTVQVLPFSAGLHPAMDGPFEILGFPESLDLDVAYLESPTSALYLEERDQVTRYNDVFDHLRAKALDPEQSRTLIIRKVQECT